MANILIADDEKEIVRLLRIYIEHLPVLLPMRWASI